jgi:hypothetical protein
MEGWARKRVIVGASAKYQKGDDHHSSLSAGHETVWTVDELRGLGFKVSGLEGWRRLRGSRGEIKYKPVKLFKVMSDVSQKVTFRFPRAANHVLAIKEMSGGSGRKRRGD